MKQLITSQQVASLVSLQRAFDPDMALGYLFKKAYADLKDYDVPDDAMVTIRIEFQTDVEVDG